MESYRESSANFLAKFLVESLEVLMKGPMIHNRQGINIPKRNLAVVSVSFDTKALQEKQVYR